MSETKLDSPLPLNPGQHQLFLDDFLVEGTENLVCGVNEAAKCPRNPVIFSPSSNRQATVYGSVLYEAGKGYRMWYSSWAEKMAGPCVHYAVSEDGVDWVKPDYDFLELEGKPSNAVFGFFRVPHIAEMWSVIEDPLERNPERRYKMLYKYKKRGEPSPYRETIMRPHRALLGRLEEEGKHDLAAFYEEVISAALFLPEQKRAAGFAFSPDGIHWNAHQSLAIPEIADISHLMIDPHTRRYRIYARDFHLPEDVHAKFGKEEWYRNVYWGRAVRLFESEDCVNWRAGDIVMHADSDDRPGDEIYSMAVFPYEGLYIGLLQIYHAFPGDNTLDIQLAVSRDGKGWTRVGKREVFLPLGGIGEWDRFNQSIASVPVFSGETVRFYYGGRTNRHKPYAGADSGPAKSGIGFASIARDRFVFYGASFDGGTLTTRPLYLPGARLRVNAKCDHGAITVGILEASGAASPLLRSEEVRLDGTDCEVRWIDSGLEKLNRERPVRLQFTLRNAKLYSFWID